ncbi:MAG TPA: hypothetical protein VE961_00325, partial [Pyrinomonadaceae bacterium]|nr:hypothetical protein [Pyrinomonadaceae bacterium]
EQQLFAEIADSKKAAANELHNLELAEEPVEIVDAKSITLSDVEPQPIEDPWLSIDLHQNKAAAGDLLSLEAVPQSPAPATQRVRPTIPADIGERLQSPDSSQRAAALVDLAEAGGEQSFELITRSFDDGSVEVRNAAARALYSLQPDLAASFTRALREASPERRRKIGAAIAGSGLAANAINSLAGEGRDRTYDAFSILFLMAKAGEVQPLMTAIAKHSNLDVRLTAVKLIGLSNQQQMLPQLRHMASREHLPEEVASAVMEAIYLLSNQTREVA